MCGAKRRLLANIALGLSHPRQFEAEAFLVISILMPVTDNVFDPCRRPFTL
jgi:hypothetical protein